MRASRGARLRARARRCGGSQSGKTGVAQNASATPAGDPKELRHVDLEFAIDNKPFPLPIVHGTVAGVPTLFLVDTGANAHILTGWIARKAQLTTRAFGDQGVDHAGQLDRDAPRAAPAGPHRQLGRPRRRADARDRRPRRRRAPRHRRLHLAAAARERRRLGRHRFPKERDAPDAPRRLGRLGGKRARARPAARVPRQGQPAPGPRVRRRTPTSKAARSICSSTPARTTPICSRRRSRERRCSRAARRATRRSTPRPARSRRARCTTRTCTSARSRSRATSI